jgi:hypothetical protein
VASPLPGRVGRPPFQEGVCRRLKFVASTTAVKGQKAVISVGPMDLAPIAVPAARPELEISKLGWTLSHACTFRANKGWRFYRS